MRKRMKYPPEVATSSGKLGVLIPGIGAVATTLMAGVELVRQGRSVPVGSLSQMGKISVAERTSNVCASICEVVDLAGLDQLVFGGWDPIAADAFISAREAKVLPDDLLSPCESFLAGIRPMTAVVDKAYASLPRATNVKQGSNKRDLVNQIVGDMVRFREERGCDRLVVIWCGSTEGAQRLGPVHQSLWEFEQGLTESHEGISPSMMYAYAAMCVGAAFINGSPHQTADIPALLKLAEEREVPIAGKDFKTGQALMQTIVAPGLKARMLGLSGWSSTSNQSIPEDPMLKGPDVMDSSAPFESVVLSRILGPEEYPELYGDIDHATCTKCHLPRGRARESWENVDLFGWLGMPLKLRVGFLGQDSFLAAPVALDLILFIDLASRAEMCGIQDWLSFYFKSPITPSERPPQHDLFAQQKSFNNVIQYLGR